MFAFLMLSCVNKSTRTWQGTMHRILLQHWLLIEVYLNVGY